MDRVYNKLVRDKIPEIIKAKGERPVVRVLNINEYKHPLENKLMEECNEVLAANGQERIEELADVLEVLMALAKLEGASLDNVRALANKKTEKRGAFDERIFLERVIESDK